MLGGAEMEHPPRPFPRRRGGSCPGGSLHLGTMRRGPESPPRDDERHRVGSPAHEGKAPILGIEGSGTMSVGRICTRTVDLADAEETAQAAARRMAERRVGSLLILDQAKRPVGLLTDRDLVLRVLDSARTRARPGSARS